MVIGLHIFSAGGSILLAIQQAGDVVIERLDPPRRAAVVMALLGLTLVGLFLITFVIVGGHWVRRLARHRPVHRRYAKSMETEGGLRDAPREIPPEASSSDTVLSDASSKNTKVET